MINGSSKKKILMFYYNEELSINSTTSVTRLVTSLSIGLSNFYHIDYFSFDQQHKPIATNTFPIYLTISNKQKFIRKVNNLLSRIRIKWFTLKRNAVLNFSAKKTHHDYAAVIVLGLDDITFVNQYFSGKKIIYWIHNISALCNKTYLANIVYVQYLVSPSKTTYKFLVKKLQPSPLIAEFCFMPNWVEDIFTKGSLGLTDSLRNKHNIPADEIIFIFSGSDLKLKGRFLLEKAIQKFASINNEPFTFIFAGGQKQNEEIYIGKIRVIYVGLLQPETLAAYYQLAKFGCVPSLAYDNCPLTLLEMIHCNVLPLTSDIGGIKEIVGSEYKFLVDEPHSVSSWINCFKIALSLPDNELAKDLEILKQSISLYNRQNAVEVIKSITHD